MPAVPIQTAEQLAGIRRACRLAREILDKAHAAVRPGVTTDEIDKVVSVHVQKCMPRLGTGGCPRCLLRCITHVAHQADQSVQLCTPTS